MNNERLHPERLCAQRQQAEHVTDPDCLLTEEKLALELRGRGL
jgi:hypothetical protein